MPNAEIALENLPLDTPLRLEAEGSGIVVVRTVAGVFAYRDVCPHAGWRLSGGRMVKGRLQCPGHGWEYDVATGRCDDVPAYRLKPVEVRIEGAFVRFQWIKGERPLVRLAEVQPEAAP